MTSITVGANTTTYLYDGDGNRVKKIAGDVTTFYVGNYYEVTNGVATKYYYFGKQRVAMRVGTNPVTYLHTDHLGSTSVTTNSSGQCTSAQWYYAYGNIRTPAPTTPCSGTPATDFAFTGQRRDASAGLMYYGARYYDSTLGRFIQADTVIPNPLDPQTLNRYTYTRNNPVRYIDPSGHCGPLCVLIPLFGALLLLPGDTGPYETDPLGDALYEVGIRAAYEPLDWGLGAVECSSGKCGPIDAIGFLPGIPFGVGAIARRIPNEFFDIKHIPGAETLLSKLTSNADEVARGAMFELEYARQHKDEIEEIGKVLERIKGGDKEIDFVLQGNVFVNVKWYDWSKYNDFLLKIETQKLIKQANDFKRYDPSAIKYVFQGYVPDEVRQALEKAGIIVEIEP